MEPYSRESTSLQLRWIVLMLLRSYGQTASGKTHTMMGTDSEPGIIPLAIAELFAFIVQVRALPF